mmetsp:Transcript_54454/g.118731  ORF Transcript_54454/g.118731 Transcript_54454/m.118731 type:complete len:133 (-) Transcript_54454:443-841(-)
MVCAEWDLSHAHTIEETVDWLLSDSNKDRYRFQPAQVQTLLKLKDQTLPLINHINYFYYLYCVSLNSFLVSIFLDNKSFVEAKINNWSIMTYNVVKILSSLVLVWGDFRHLNTPCITVCLVSAAMLLPYEYY